MAGQDRQDADGFRRRGGARSRPGPLSRLSALALATVALPIIWPAVARAQDAAQDIARADVSLPLGFGTMEVIQLALFVGVTGAAMLSAILLIRERGRMAAENAEFRGRVAELDTALHRAEALLNLRDQRILVWSDDSRRPDLVGTLDDASVPDDRATFLAFGRWLAPASAAALERAIAALRGERHGFDLVVETARGMPLEAQGRVGPGHVAVRFLSLSQERRDHAELQLRHRRLESDHANLAGLVDALDMPAWLRAADGRLTWVNAAFERHSGHTLAQARGRHIHDVTQSPDHKATERAMADGQEHSAEVSCTARNGGRYLVAFDMKPLQG
ncbi:MAG TPA: PAS domain-containing protein, partial [Aquamicrobium sp.]|nr:PAS domain-containing protein [Aquamicrobium sp.]